MLAVTPGLRIAKFIENNMPMTTDAIATPYYMLNEGNCSIGPDCLQFRSGSDYSAVYGFSSKAAFDRFSIKSPQNLVPYPLVKVYLSKHADGTNAGTALLVLDAAGPDEPFLYAATMQDVLDAHLKRTSKVTATHRLTFDQKAGGYRVESDTN